MSPEREHDQGRIDAWVRRHQVGAWRFIRLRGCPADVADDLVQDALMAAVHKRIDAEPDPRAAAWLRRAVDNLWRMHRRSEGRRTRHVEAALVERALQRGARDDDGEAWTQALRSCLRVLDDRSRRLLDLHYSRGASRDAIADEFGMQANGIKALLRRVRGSLRECILRKVGHDQERS